MSAPTVPTSASTPITSPDSTSIHVSTPTTVPASAPTPAPIFASMFGSTPSQAKAIIEIDPKGDILLEVTDYDYHILTAQGRHPIKRIVWFKVSREVMEKKSKHFEGLFRFHFQKTTDNLVKLEEETITSSELWLRVIHGNMTEAMNKISIEEVWHAIVMGRKRFLQNHTLNEWFTGWLAHNGGDDFQNFELKEIPKLLYPLEEFEHAQGFLYATKRLAYEWKGSIKDESPIYYRSGGHLYLDQRVIAALNDARVGLKGKIHNPIWSKTELFIYRDCDCCEKALHSFLRSLCDTGVWPLEKHFYGKYKISVSDALARLRGFTHSPPENACARCSINLEDFVQIAIASVEGNFEGLCLCCIAKQGTTSHDLAIQDGFTQRYNLGCKIEHGQPTWHYSYRARSKEQDAHRRERDEERRKRKREQEEETEDGMDEPTHPPSRKYRPFRFRY